MFIKTIFQPALAVALLFNATLAVPFSVAAVTIPTSSMTETKSGNDLILSFPTARPYLYTLQTSPDLQQPWANFQTGIQGDGTVKSVAITNGISGSRGYYRLLIQSPAGLLLPQSIAFSYLGHSCGGIDEQVYATGFDPTNGYPTGDVYLSTTCNGSGRGGHSTTYSAWAGVTWDFGGYVVSSARLLSVPTVNPTFIALGGL